MLQKAYNIFFGENFKTKFENFVLYLSIGGFLVHLFLIVLFNLDLLPFESDKIELLKDPISAVYTPFSVILIFEVYLLVYFIPKSFTTSIAKQYEVISLILIRKIFKDIANINVDNSWFDNPDDILLTVDMVTVLIIFFLISQFYHTAARVKKQETGVNVSSLIRIKEKLAVLLIVVFITLSGYNLIDWAINSYHFSIGKVSETISLDSLFYDDFFTALILVDVLILIISFKYTENYNLLIRNSGFVISTILIRIALYGSEIANTLLMLFSVLFGWIILLIYRRFSYSDKLEDDTNNAV